MRFANPFALWFLSIVPLIIAYALFMRSHDLPELRFPTLKKIEGILPRKVKWDFGLILIGCMRALVISLIIVALARPQRGLRSEEVTTKATDIFLCLDASRSMLTIDFKPENRFIVAKKVISDFIKGREHDRMGLVLFAEHAVTQCPLTLDRGALINVVDHLDVGSIPPDQTAIGVGIATAVNRLKNSTAKSKIIVLVTDGSNNAGSVDPVTAAKTAAAYGIKIYTIGAASPEGGLIPIPDPIMGQRLVPSGSDLDEDTLLKVAAETNGKYFRAKSSQSLQTIFKEIDSLEKTDIRVKEFVDYEEMYIWFLSLAYLFLFIELLINKTVFRTVP